MKLRTLELDKFGAFDNLRLNFRADAKLHVVYGPNEAGKSTALAAVGALLYGVPERTPFAFRFPGQELRIGAEIVDREGAALVVRRRKGRKNTLQGDDGAVLPDDALEPMLGGVGEDVFRRSFGLDPAALREGGDAMLRADGDVGATLLEAASGLRNLLDLRSDLEAKADEIFGDRRAAHRLFYQALDRHSAARKAIDTKELRVDAWRRLNGEIEALGQKVEAIRAERRASEAERARLGRLKRAVPVLRDIADAERRLADFADLPDFAPGATDVLAAALQELRAAGEAEERASAEERRSVENAARIVVDQASLAEASAIEELFGASGGYANEKRDLPRVQAEADQYAAALERHARALGLPDAEALETRRPTAAALAALRGLIAEGRKIQADAEAKALRHARERKAVEALRLEREARPPAMDPSQARETFAALGKIAERSRKADKEREDLADEARRLGERLARLDPEVADLDALAARPLPRDEDISRFEKAFDAAHEAARGAAGRREAVEQEMAGTTARLATLAAGRPLATATRIEAAREVREEAWRPLRATLLGADDAPPPGALPDRVRDFERLTTEADRLADEASSDAARLAKHGLETQRLDEQTRAYALAQASEAEEAAKRGEIERAWIELWQGISAHPRSPAQMRDWIGRITEAFGARDRLLQRKAAHEAETRGLAAVAPALGALAAELGLPPVEGLDVGRQADRVERRLDEAAKAFNASRATEARYAEAGRLLAEAARDDTEAAERFGAWRVRAETALAAAGVVDAATVEAGEAALDVWDKALSDGENLRDRARRVAGMRRNMEAFEAEARALASRCAPEAVDLPADSTARRLNERLAAARKSEAQRVEAARSVDAARRSLAETSERRSRADAALAQATASLPPDSDPSVLIARERERAELAETLRQKRRHLLDVADGVEEPRLLAEMEGFDPDAAAARIAELERENEDRERLENEHRAQRALMLQRREELEAGVGAEEAWQQRRNAEAELLETARRWAVLKAASALLGGALDRHRAARRDPLMTRAGAIFALLTGGAFASLDQAFGDDDELQLVGVRRSGENVRVKALSEGTRDQLYLALRLAVIENYAARSEAPPFVGDDIFASFDDERTGAGLEALAAIGDRVQTILFTHHRHVADAAKVRLGAAADVIEIR